MADKTPIQELVAKLPPELQSWAETYIKFLANNTLDDLRDWVNLILLGDWQKAYEQVAAVMTTEELEQELDRINENLKLQNITNVSKMQAQRVMFGNLFNIIFAMAQISIGL